MILFHWTVMIMINDIFSNIIVNIAMLMIIGYVLPKTRFFRRTVFEHQKSTQEKILFGFLSRRTFLLQEIFQGLICSKSLKISLFILSSIVSLLVLLK